VNGIGALPVPVKAWGSVILAAGMAEVPEPSVNSASVILLTIQACAGTPATPTVSSRQPGRGFVISSLSAGDLSTVGWAIIG
jgi:hypothetical protein